MNNQGVHESYCDLDHLFVPARQAAHVIPERLRESMLADATDLQRTLVRDVKANSLENRPLADRFRAFTHSGKLLLASVITGLFMGYALADELGEAVMSGGIQIVAGTDLYSGIDEILGIQADE